MPLESVGQHARRGPATGPRRSAAIPRAQPSRRPRATGPTPGAQEPENPEGDGDGRVIQHPARPTTVASFRTWRGSQVPQSSGPDHHHHPRGGGRASVDGGGGERGIRTLGGLPHTRFPVVHLRPLGHLSKSHPHKPTALGGERHPVTRDGVNWTRIPSGKRKSGEGGIRTRGRQNRQQISSLPPSTTRTPLHTASRWGLCRARCLPGGLLLLAKLAKEGPQQVAALVFPDAAQHRKAVVEADIV